MRETVKFKTTISSKEYEFEMYAKATMLERQQIENIVASFVGGHNELSKMKRVNEGLKESIKKERNKTIFENPLDLFIASDCDDTLNRGYWFATLKTLIINPPFDIAKAFKESITQEEFEKMMSAAGGALNSFQGQREKRATKQTDNRTSYDNQKRE